LYDTNDTLSGKLNQPAPPVNVNVTGTVPNGTAGSVVLMRNPKYKYASAGIKVSKNALKSIWDMTADSDGSALEDKIDKFVSASLELVEERAKLTDSGSGSVETTKLLSVQSLGVVTGPYGTADNTYATSDQNPELPGFTGDITQQMDYRADCDPRFQYIARSSPRDFGYSAGYLSGDGQAPNGYPTGSGISFPQNPQVGDYFLRIDYLPQLLFRWDGTMWVRISENVRTDTGFTYDDKSLLSGFINNDNEIYLQQTQTTVPEAQGLSTILRLSPDPLPPIE
jgi:hypothetical protein